MNDNEEWQELLNYLISNAIEMYKSSKEYEGIKKQYNEMDSLLRDKFTVNQKGLIEECIYEIGLAAEHESEVVYQQGMKDCVWLLKNLGVIS